MPASVTHAYFAYDIYNNLDSSIKNRIDLNRLKMFSQSTDPFMFSFSKESKDYQYIFHTTKTKDFFINLINYIKSNNLYNDTLVCSYLVGSIAHYMLDSTTHPYIVYKTGHFKKKKPSTYKYNCRHNFMEIFIDNYMIENREKINPYKFDICKFCFNKDKFSKELEDTINYSFKSTYNISNISDIYYKSIKNMIIFTKFFRKDRFGIKKFFYKLIDTFTPRKCFRFESLSYHYPLYDKHNYLNSNHEVWRNPIDYNLTSDKSFVELYVKALKESKRLIVEVFKYFDDDKIDLNKLFTNKSYVTGLDCDINKELKYFEF